MYFLTGSDDQPLQLGLQLMGNNPSVLAASAEVIGGTHADFIDLNFEYNTVLLTVSL